MRDLCARTPVLAVRRGALLNAPLRARFDVIDDGVWVIVLDADGAALDQFWLDSLWSCAHDESLARFDELLVERIDRSLALTTSVEERERRWRSSPGDAEAFEAWIDRLEEMKRYRQVEAACRGVDGPLRDLARIRGYAVRTRDQRTWAAGEREAYVRAGEALLAELGGHAEAPRVRVALAAVTR